MRFRLILLAIAFTLFLPTGTVFAFSTISITSYLERTAGLYFNASSSDVVFDSFSADLHTRAGNPLETEKVVIEIYEIYGTSSDLSLKITESNPAYHDKTFTSDYQNITFTFPATITLERGHTYVFMMTFPDETFEGGEDPYIRDLEDFDNQGFNAYAQFEDGGLIGADWDLISLNSYEEFVPAHSWFSFAVPNVSGYSNISLYEPCIGHSASNPYPKCSHASWTPNAIIEGFVTLDPVDGPLKLEIIVNYIDDVSNYSYVVNSVSRVLQEGTSTEFYEELALDTSTVSSSTYRVSVCLLKSDEVSAFFGVGKCVTALYGNGYTEEQFQQHLRDSGLIVPELGPNSTTTGNPIADYFASIFNNIRYGWPYGYVSRMYDDYQSTKTQHSTTTGFGTSLDMSAFGLPATTAYIDFSAMVAKADEFSPDLFDTIDGLLWGLFWLFITYRVVNGTWQHGLEYGGSQYKEAVMRERAIGKDFRYRFKGR